MRMSASPKAGVSRQLKTGLLLTLGLVALIWPIWLVWGLRYVTHDDLAASWVALDSSVGWIEFADFVARLQRRVQAYVWMPLWLLGNALAETRWGDIAMALQMALMLGLLGWLGVRTAGLRMGLLFAVLLAFGFALHPYFMAPPGFPLMGLGPSLAFLLCLFGLHAAARGARWGAWLAAFGWFVPDPVSWTRGCTMRRA